MTNQLINMAPPTVDNFFLDAPQSSTNFISEVCWPSWLPFVSWPLMNPDSTTATDEHPILLRNVTRSIPGQTQAQTICHQHHWKQVSVAWWCISWHFRWFERFITLCILVNCVCLAFDTPTASEATVKSMYSSYYDGGYFCIYIPPRGVSPNRVCPPPNTLSLPRLWFLYFSSSWCCRNSVSLHLRYWSNFKGKAQVAWTLFVLSLQSFTCRNICNS